MDTKAFLELLDVSNNCTAYAELANEKMKLGMGCGHWDGPQTSNQRVFWS
jgi:hypothetical protein